MNQKHDKTILPLRKIAIVGPESTGKSTMATYLAHTFNTICVPEYARYYCKDLGNKYTLEDEIAMYYGQLALEDALIPHASNRILITDTTVMTIKIWSDRLFGSTPDAIVEGIRKRPYDLYLLMDIDLPWEDDPLRDFPLEREHFMQVWQTELAQLDAQVMTISGTDQTRFTNGVKAIQDYLNHIEG